jgi:hypothetical protein
MSMFDSSLIAALPATYGGVLFRSRTEARWAVFLDALGVRWEYEREGYALPCGNYLPDFWLEDLGVFLEIKGRAPLLAESDKCLALANATGRRVMLAWGAPGAWLSWPVIGDNDSPHMIGPGGDWDNVQWMCACRRCGAVGFRYEGRSSRLCGCFKDDGVEGADDARIARAAMAARAARFW